MDFTAVLWGLTASSVIIVAIVILAPTIWALVKKKIKCGSKTNTDEENLFNDNDTIQQSGSLEIAIVQQTRNGAPPLSHFTQTKDGENNDVKHGTIEEPPTDRPRSVREQRKKEMVENINTPRNNNENQSSVNAKTEKAHSQRESNLSSRTNSPRKYTSEQGKNNTSSKTTSPREYTSEQGGGNSSSRANTPCKQTYDQLDTSSTNTKKDKQENDNRESGSVITKVEPKVKFENEEKMSSNVSEQNNDTIITVQSQKPDTSLDLSSINEDNTGTASAIQTARSTMVHNAELKTDRTNISRLDDPMATKKLVKSTEKISQTICSIDSNDRVLTNRSNKSFMEQQITTQRSNSPSNELGTSRSNGSKTETQPPGIDVDTKHIIGPSVEETTEHKVTPLTSLKTPAKTTSASQSPRILKSQAMVKSVYSNRDPIIHKSSNIQKAFNKLRARSKLLSSSEEMFKRQRGRGSKLQKVGSNRTKPINNQSVERSSSFPKTAKTENPKTKLKSSSQVLFETNPSINDSPANARLAFQQAYVNPTQTMSPKSDAYMAGPNIGTEQLSPAVRRSEPILQETLLKSSSNVSIRGAPFVNTDLASIDHSDNLSHSTPFETFKSQTFLARISQRRSLKSNSKVSFASNVTEDSISRQNKIFFKRPRTKSAKSMKSQLSISSHSSSRHSKKLEKRQRKSLAASLAAMEQSPYINTSVNVNRLPDEVKGLIRTPSWGTKPPLSPKRSTFPRIFSTSEDKKKSVNTKTRSSRRKATDSQMQSNRRSINTHHGNTTHPHHHSNRHATHQASSNYATPNSSPKRSPKANRINPQEPTRNRVSPFTSKSSHVKVGIAYPLETPSIPLKVVSPSPRDFEADRRKTMHSDQQIALQNIRKNLLLDGVTNEESGL